MNRRIKQVWLLAILSSFLLIGLQTYWLYNSVTYSMGEMGKKNAEKAEQAIVTYQTNIGAAVKEKSHIGYVVTTYFSDYKSPCTTVCSPLDTDTIIGGVVYSKPGFGNVMEKRDTFDLRETDSNNSFDCLNTYITYQLTRFDKAHFDRFISRKLGNDFIGAEMKTGKHRLWQTRIVEPPTLFHHEMLVEVPFNPIQYQSMQMRMQVPMLPILKGMIWQMIGSLLVTIMLLLSIAYLIKVMLLQKKVDKMRSDFVHTMIHELKRPVQTLKMCVSVFSAQKTDEKDENALIMETVREESDNLTAYLAKLREVIRAEEHIPLQITSFDIHAALLNLVAVYPMLLKSFLQQHGYDVTYAGNGKKAWEQFPEVKPDLVLLDINMPEMDGYEVAERIRTIDPKVLIFFLTDRTEKNDRLKGFSLKANDYLAKPFYPEELLARIEERFSMNESETIEEEVYHFGETTFCYNNNELRTRSSRVLITSRQADILRLLAKNIGNVVSKEMIQEAVWGTVSYANSLAVNVQMTYLRHALQHDVTVKIESLKKKGYVLTLLSEV